MRRAWERFPPSAALWRGCFRTDRLTPTRELMANSPEILARKVRAGDRASLARAITLIESKRADHQQAAHRLVQDLLAETGKATRVGITGSPGVGKSMTIDALGTYLTSKG